MRINNNRKSSKPGVQLTRSKRKRLQSSKIKQLNNSKKTSNVKSPQPSNQSRKTFKKFKDTSLKKCSPKKKTRKRKSIQNRSKSATPEVKKLKLQDDIICISSSDEEESECSFNPATEAINSTQQQPLESPQNADIGGFYEDRNPGIDVTVIPTYSEISSQEDFKDSSVIFVGKMNSSTEEGEIKDDDDDDTVILVEDNITPRGPSPEIIDLDLEKTIRPVSPALDFIPLPKVDSNRTRKKNKWGRKKKDNVYEVKQKHSSSSSNSPDASKATKTKNLDENIENKKRMIIIDGSNVAFGHSNRKFFSIRGIEICIEYFKKLGHEVTAVLPQFRMRKAMSTDQELLEKLKSEGNITLTPCKNLPGKRTMSYDDRFILQIAAELDAVVISNDNYRDLIEEDPKFKEIIENRVVGYTWIKDLFIIPADPYGKNGPKLKEILNKE